MYPSSIGSASLRSSLIIVLLWLVAGMPPSAMSPGVSGTNGGIKEMNENIDIDTTFVPDDSASHSWTERDSELVEEYAAQLMAMSI